MSHVPVAYQVCGPHSVHRPHLTEQEAQDCCADTWGSNGHVRPLYAAPPAADTKPLVLTEGQKLAPSEGISTKAAPQQEAVAKIDIAELKKNSGMPSWKEIVWNDCIDRLAELGLLGHEALNAPTIEMVRSLIRRGDFTETRCFEARAGWNDALNAVINLYTAPPDADTKVQEQLKTGNDFSYTAPQPEGDRAEALEFMRMSALHVPFKFRGQYYAHLETIRRALSAPVGRTEAESRAAFAEFMEGRLPAKFWDQYVWDNAVAWATSTPAGGVSLEGDAMTSPEAPTQAMPDYILAWEINPGSNNGNWNNNTALNGREHYTRTATLKPYTERERMLSEALDNMAYCMPRGACERIEEHAPAIALAAEIVGQAAIGKLNGQEG